MGKRMGLLWVVLSLVFSIFPLKLEAATLEVGPAGYLYTSIQTAINASSNGDTVLVHDGTYVENINFNGKAITVRSQNGSAVTIIDGSNPSDPNYGSVVIFDSIEGTSSVLDGFTLTNGSGTDREPVGSRYGGGIYCGQKSSPTIANCTISGNTVTGILGDGGGIYCGQESSPTITNCTISSNSASNGGSGIYCGQKSSPTITNCTISGNTITGTLGDGGGIYCGWISSPTITNCTITSNTANSGGGIFSAAGLLTITNCTISGNTAISGAGGGIYCSDSFVRISYCTVTANQGDGMRFSCLPSSSLVTNCTIADNSGIGISCNNGASPYIVNTILWNNGSGISADPYANPKLSYCNIQGGYSGLGNINTDPLFVNPGAADYHLQAGSPCIDVGQPRIYDSNTSRSDMGAYGGEGGSDPNPLNITVVTDGSGDYTSIQNAIDYAVTGDTITILPGTYNENLIVGGKKVSLIGRDGASSTIIDGSSGPGSVIALINVGTGVRVQGLSIRNAVAAIGGGGIYAYLSSPTITDCIISNNSTRQVESSLHLEHEHGGGIYCEKGALTVTDCTITSNTAAGWGGGIFSGWEDSSATITNCTISSNKSVYGFGGGIGGGYTGKSDSKPMIISNCTITNNRAEEGAGGGISGPHGYDWWPYIYADFQVTNSKISGNIAKAAGGILCRWTSDTTISNCEISNNTSLGTILSYSVDEISGGGITVDDKSKCLITNSLIVNNTAMVKGGGGVYVAEETHTDIVNCTFNGNTTPGRGGAVHVFIYNQLDMANNILWGNTATQGDNEIHVNTEGGFSISYSDIQGGWSGAGNINTNPLFVGGGDYRLQAGSPCIDAANSYGLAPVTDKDGIPRYDDPATPNTGTGPNGNYYDMGAYELHPACNPIYVPDNYTTIQAAINAAHDGCEIIVRDGTYTENINFSGKAIIVRSENGADVTTINGGGSGNVVTFISGEGAGSVLDGFTITNGSSYIGGGITCSGSPTITNCIITNNTADYGGGGIACHGSGSPTITNCTITGNTVTDFGGGGIYNYMASPTIENCLITSNTASSGGGICIEIGPPTITNCIIRNNIASGPGGGIAGYASSPTATKCTISSNTASVGGGIYIERSTLTASNCTISNNTASKGGGIYNLAYAINDPSTLTITNCTVTGNSSTDSGGGVYYDCTNYSSLTMLNDILWGNAVGGLTDATTSLYVYGDCSGSGGGGLSGVSITYSDVGDPANPSLPHPGTGNIYADPLFAGSGDYHLTEGSPCVDAGTGEGAPVDDIDGNNRPHIAGYDIGSDEVACTDADADGYYAEAGCGTNVDNCPTVANPGQEDLDGDGLGDVCDNDIDGDCLPNGVDPCPYDADCDDDGLPDGVCSPGEDLNNNGVVDPGETDPQNLDTDADGIQDGTETGLTVPVIPGHTDMNIFVPDADPTTQTDPTNPDSDGDSLLDGAEDLNKNGRVDIGETDPNNPDSDGDGVNDSADAFPLDPTETTDTDLDGIGDNADNCPVVANADQADTDADGIGDACDLWLELKKTEVEWEKNKIKLSGKLALPTGKSYFTTSPIGAAFIDLPAPLGQVVAQSVNFTVKGDDGKKWEYKDSSATLGLRKFKIDWKGAKFDYNQTIRIKSEHLGYDATTLEIEHENVTGAFTITLGGVTISVDENGGATATPPEGVVIDLDDDGEIEVDLPFALTLDMTIDISGAVSDTMLVSDYYTAAIGKFKIDALFDPNGVDVASLTPTLFLKITLGEEGFPGTLEIGPSDWKNVGSKEWKYKQED